MSDTDAKSRPPDDIAVQILRALHGREPCPRGSEARMPGDAAAEVERLRSVLRSIEWVGGKLYGVFGPIMPCCPACRGIRPGYSPLGPTELGHRHGHRDGCAIAAALGEPTEGDAQIEGRTP